jgi:hypothetical protein
MGTRKGYQETAVKLAFQAERFEMEAMEIVRAVEGLARDS